jgi:hypothetical protein
MRRIIIIVTTAIVTTMSSNCYADCSCDDWVIRSGYCVDYIKSRIQTFQIPKDTTEIANLKNKEIGKVAEGDVAMFYVSNYWHVAYVEIVHLDKHGNAAEVDVSEMNYGGQMSFHDYKSKWSPKNKSEWERALCCGVTNKYGQKSSRKNIPLNSIKQIWSPVAPVSEGANKGRNDTAFGGNVNPLQPLTVAIPDGLQGSAGRTLEPGTATIQASPWLSDSYAK